MQPAHTFGFLRLGQDEVLPPDDAPAGDNPELLDPFEEDSIPDGGSLLETVATVAVVAGVAVGFAAVLSRAR